MLWGEVNSSIFFRYFWTFLIDFGHSCTNFDRFWHLLTDYGRFLPSCYSFQLSSVGFCLMIQVPCNLRHICLSGDLKVILRHISAKLGWSWARLSLAIPQYHNIKISQYTIWSSTIVHITILYCSCCSLLGVLNVF